MVQVIKVTNWLVISVFHDRYYFSTEVTTEFNKSIKELCGDPDLENIRPGIWGIDRTRRVDNKIIPYSVLYIDLNEQPLEELYTEYLWGHTKSKFGLLDKERDL